MGELSKLLAENLASSRLVEISDRVEDTFGPNPCQHLRMVNQETGERIEHLCDTKRCVHCGPRKQMTIQLQMEATFGKYCYITTFDNREDLDRAIRKIKKIAQRDGQQHPYQSVGDTTLGWILVSDIPPGTGQGLKTLSDWMRRILERYHNAAQRIRRSYSLGRVSLVSLRVGRGTRDKPSIWQVMTRRWALVRAVEDDNWDDMRDEIDYRDGNLYDEPPNWVDPA